MKYNSKQLIAAIALAAVILPQTSLAVSSQSAGVQKGNKFCSNLEVFLKNTNDKTNAKDADRLAKFAQREKDLLAKRAEQDKKRIDQQAEVLTKQTAHYERLLTKASTTEQKAAINEFIASIKNAVMARQTAMDAARDAYRTGMDQITAGRKEKTESAFKLMQQTIEQAVAQAKVDCQNGVENGTIRTNLQNAVKAAREVYKTTIQNFGTIGDQAKALVSTRQSAFEKAQNDFKTALEAAKTALRTKLASL